MAGNGTQVRHASVKQNGDQVKTTWGRIKQKGLSVLVASVFFARVETPCVQRLHRSSCAGQERVTIQVAVKETTRKTSKTNTTPTKNPKRNPKRKTATWGAAQKAVSAKMRGRETGAMNSCIFATRECWVAVLVAVSLFLGAVLTC